MQQILSFFSPPEFDSFELTQKAKFLHFTLLVITVACFFLGVQNMQGDTSLDLVLFILALLSILVIPLNKGGHYATTAIFIGCLILLVITFSLMDGIGLQDAGLIAYPIFMIYCSFLFSKRASFFTTLLCAGSVLLIYYLDLGGYLVPAIYFPATQLKIILILLVAAGFFLWALMDNWERIMGNLSDAYDLTLLGWAKALEFRDQETEGHSLRVTDMTLVLARHLGVSSWEMNHIRRGAHLHDIGKMGIPDSILLKNGQLTKAEWEVVKKHPVYARELLENIPFLKPALVIPYCHHERWDGSGYPLGLAAEEIPFAARIFAVVDVWDALISDRPYRAAWPRERARAYLHENSGVQFDPKVVSTFLELVEKGRL